MKIKLNELEIDVSFGETLKAVRLKYKPNADVIVLNGAIQEEDVILRNGDHVMLIKKGECPPEEELEAVMAARHTPGVHEKMKKSCVGIAGLGGLGSSVAIALARVGTGKLILVDFDIIEPSNLNRQQYFIDQLGLPKADALKDNLKKINPYVDVEAHFEKVSPTNINNLFKDVDILIEAFDRPDQKAMVLQYSKAPKIIAASGLAGYASSEEISIRKLGENIFIVGDLKTGAAPGCGLMAPRVGIAAHIQANLAMQLLLEKNE